MKIFIDAGHGGRFTGAVATTDQGLAVYEKDLNLAAAIMLEKILKEDRHDVFMSRSDDRDFGPTVAHDLMVRCDMENQISPDCFISLHCNSFSSTAAKGFEIWTSLGLTNADSLAEMIYMEFDDGFDIEMRFDISDGDHDREKHLYVLDHTVSPAVLLELGFMSNPDDLRRLMDKDHISELMKATAKGIELWSVLH